LSQSARDVYKVAVMDDLKLFLLGLLLSSSADEELEDTAEAWHAHYDIWWPGRDLWEAGVAAAGWQPGFSYYWGSASWT
jgi:hypothetical protein